MDMDQTADKHTTSNMLRKIMFSLPMHFVALLLVVHQFASQSFAVADSYSFVGQENHPQPPPGRDPVSFPNPNPPTPCNPQYTVIPQYIPTSGSIFANVPAVTLFTNTFLEAVYSTDILKELFDLSQTTARQYAIFVRRFFKDYLSARGIQNADLLSEWASRAILKYFHVLTLPVVVRAFANSVANFLYVERVLQIENARNFAKQYAKSMVDSANVYINSNPTSKFLAIGNGFINFFLEAVSYTDAKAELLTFYFGNEWFVAAVNYRYW